MWLGRVWSPHPSAVAGLAPSPRPFPSLALQSLGWSLTSQPAGLGGLWGWEWLGPTSVEPQNIWVGKAREPGAARAPTGGEGAEERGRKLAELIKRSTWMEQGRGMQGLITCLPVTASPGARRGLVAPPWQPSCCSAASPHPGAAAR